MGLTRADMAAPYQRILASCEPFLVSYPGNYGALDLAPFGQRLDSDHLYTATSLRSRDVVDGLHHLDGLTFGDQDMRMPRWVMFDCGEFPGIVFGFGQRASALPSEVREVYQAMGDEADERFVPLSMWVAIRCAESGAWFGHNLSSANLVLKGEHALPGLATLTKVFGVKLARATKQYGATQWVSKSLGLHLRLGPMKLLSAYTPAHTHPHTFAYQIEVDEHELGGCLRPGWAPPTIEADRLIRAGDEEATRALHGELEAGQSWYLAGAQRDDRGGQMLQLKRANRSG